MKVEERLLKYVGYHTTSDEASDKIPSSDREFALARELESELKELGLSKVVLTDHCYVYGLLPATAGMEHKKAVGFIAHMDTASKQHIASVIVTQQLWLDIFPGKIRCSIHMTEAMCCLEAVANT